jgi:hypothetical protein
MTAVISPIAVRCEKSERDSQSDLADIVVGLTVNDWMTHAILGISSPDPVTEEVRNNDFHSTR